MKLEDLCRTINAIRAAQRGDRQGLRYVKASIVARAIALELAGLDTGAPSLPQGELSPDDIRRWRASWEVVQ